jgi:hypothetical protein
MQNAGHMNPAREDRGHPIPRHFALTATAQDQPPQSPQSLSEAAQPVEVSWDRAVSVVADDHPLQPFTDGSDRLVHPVAQFCLNRMQLVTPWVGFAQKRPFGLPVLGNPLSETGTNFAGLFGFVGRLVQLSSMARSASTTPPHLRFGYFVDRKHYLRKCRKFQQLRQQSGFHRQYQQLSRQRSLRYHGVLGRWYRLPLQRHFYRTLAMRIGWPHIERQPRCFFLPHPLVPPR